MPNRNDYMVPGFDQRDYLFNRQAAGAHDRFSDLGSRLRDQMNGADSLSAQQYQQMNDQNVAQQRSLMASASPQNAAMMARVGSQNIGRLNQGAAFNTGMLGIQERNAATGQLQDFNRSNDAYQLQTQGMGLNQAGMQQQGMMGYARDQAAEDAAKRAQRMAMFGAGLSAVGTIAGGALGGPGGAAVGGQFGNLVNQSGNQSLAQTGSYSPPQAPGAPAYPGGQGPYNGYPVASDVRAKTDIEPGGRRADQWLDSVSGLMGRVQGSRGLEGPPTEDSTVASRLAGQGDGSVRQMFGKPKAEVMARPVASGRGPRRSFPGVGATPPDADVPGTVDVGRYDDQGNRVDFADLVNPRHAQQQIPIEGFEPDQTPRTPGTSLAGIKDMRRRAGKVPSYLIPASESEVDQPHDAEMMPEPIGKMADYVPSESEVNPPYTEDWPEPNSGLGPAGLSTAQSRYDDQLLASMEPQEYNYKRPEVHGQGRQLGVMAQDLERGGPKGQDMVFEGPGGVKSINSQKAIPTMLGLVGRLADRLGMVEKKAGVARPDELRRERKMSGRSELSRERKKRR